MKVLVCIPCLLTGGTEIQTLSLVEALVAAGHTPIVACYFEHDEGMVKRYEDAGADVRLLSPEGRRPNGVKAICNFLWKKLKQLVKEIKPDVAHVQYMTPGSLPIIMLKLLGVKDILVTTHTPADIYSPLGLRIIKWLSRTCITGFQCITLLAEKSYFGSASLFDGKMKRHFTIYNSIPSHIEIAINSRSFSNQSTTVGVVSRLAEIKGMDLIIPAFNEARKSNPKLKLLIVGDGSLKSLMEEQRDASPYCEDIEFVGLKPQKELQEWYGQIDILLMPSRSEGFGLTAIEGMARGCVLVAANTGGLPEVVSSECGYLHKVGDIQEMAQKIVEASNSKTIEKKSQNAIQRSRDFSSEKYFNQIKELYNAII